MGPRGISIEFDAVMAVSSIRNRVTPGQYYRSMTALKALRGGVVEASGVRPECMLMDPHTGIHTEMVDDEGTVSLS